MAPRFAPRALLFDMDGLLVDSEPLWFELERGFASRRGFEWTAAHARACIGQGITATIRTMGETFGFEPAPDRDAAELLAQFVERVGELSPKRGARELLDFARGRVPLALASSSPARLVDAVLDALALRPYFGAVLSGEAVANPKPAPDLFLRAAAELGVAEGCVVFEDSYAGVVAARAAQMAVIAVPEHDSVRARVAPIADCVVADLDAARPLLAL